MKIAIGNRRTDKCWKNSDISWEDFCLKISSTLRTTETVEEYRKMKKGLHKFKKVCYDNPRWETSIAIWACSSVGRAYGSHP